MQIVLSEGLAFEPAFSKPRARRVAPRQRRLQARCLVFRRKQLNGGNKLHSVKYRELAMCSQVRRVVLATAIPPPSSKSAVSAQGAPHDERSKPRRRFVIISAI